MNIQWNTVTWYSKLAAVIFFIGILPVWTFYLGTQYQQAIDVVKDTHFEFSSISQTRSPGFEIATSSITNTSEGQTKGFEIATSSITQAPQGQIYKAFNKSDATSGFKIVIPNNYTVNEIDKFESEAVVDFRSPQMLTLEKKIIAECENTGHPGICEQLNGPDYDVEFNEWDIVNGGMQPYLTLVKTFTVNNLSWKEYQLSSDFMGTSSLKPLYFFYTQMGSNNFAFMGPDESTVLNVVKTFQFLQ